MSSKKPESREVNGREHRIARDVPHDVIRTCLLQKNPVRAELVR